MTGNYHCCRTCTVYPKLKARQNMHAVDCGRYSSSITTAFPTPHMLPPYNPDPKLQPWHHVSVCSLLTIIIDKWVSHVLCKDPNRIPRPIFLQKSNGYGLFVVCCSSIPFTHSPHAFALTTALTLGYSNIVIQKMCFLQRFCATADAKPNFLNSQFRNPFRNTTTHVLRTQLLGIKCLEKLK